MTKKILALTGTRADYGIYKPVFEAIQSSNMLSLELIVTGMHLKEAFGHTVDIIEKDGFPILAKLDTLTTDDTPRAMTEYVGRTLIACAAVLQEHRPDIFFVLGDRGEMLAGALAAAELQIPVAHLHGGETTGHIDERVRHAVTHLSTIHLTTAEAHTEAVIRMRHSDENVHTVGAPALDTALRFTPVPKEQLCADMGLDPNLRTMILLQHPDTMDALTPAQQLQATLDAVEDFDGNILVVGANADAGGMHMNTLLEPFAHARKNRAFVLSLPHEQFLSWEACSDVLVGNSSSGIIEAASFHLPAVNVGNRQKGRTRSGNVIDVPYDARTIRTAIHTALEDTAFRTRLQQVQNAYGDGHAAERIVHIFENTKEFAI